MFLSREGIKATEEILLGKHKLSRKMSIPLDAGFCFQKAIVDLRFRACPKVQIAVPALVAISREEFTPKQAFLKFRKIRCPLDDAV
ncbi:hypothetical protein D3C76_1039010 [compost metagenome]